ncbi:hypothetical protein OIU77_023690 [Salix suchowensis]|uniref:Cysteine-rich transmembrane CYSTM domain-containing protein n=1 Tax=Salix suchowensis TaxID=1278906 RepID=A0ABQ9C7T3_9ROSI|nr:hypothetical protein OIU77_023690 [Salix suchowensis]
MSSPAPGVSPVPFNSTPPPLISNLTSPPPPDTTNKTASQAPPLLASSPRGPPGPGRAFPAGTFGVDSGSSVRCAGWCGYFCLCVPEEEKEGSAEIVARRPTFTRSYQR